MYTEITGQTIRELRKSYDMSQQEFATSLGVSTRWLSDVERMDLTPEKVYLRAIANLLAEIKLNSEPDSD